MATITVQLDEETRAFLAQQVAAGYYPDEAAALQGGVRALQHYEREQQHKEDALLAAIQEGFDSGIAEGDVISRVRAKAGLPPRAPR